MKSTRDLGAHFSEGEEIFKQGDSADCMYVVQKGKVEIVMETEFGANRLIIKKKGDIFGEISLFSCKSRFATARALTDCVVLKVDEHAFITKLHQDPSLAFRTIQGMARRIYEQDHILMSGFFHEDEPCCDVTGFTSYIDLALFLDGEVKRARRLMQTMAFAIIDMDGYGKLCQQHGVELAESLLKSLAGILRTQMLRGDVVGRFGEDRFGVLLYESDGAASTKVMEKVRLSFKRFVASLEVKGLEATFSCGIAIYPEHDLSAKLSKAAFKALTQGKMEGKDRIVLASPGADWKKKSADKVKPRTPNKRSGWGFSLFTDK
ncbi:MAG: cyclic nucleotide-binding domain-containing protein [Magnetococcales bacterium]|nr:cyclic nucleotide-binding domain-containing protein [Magnetococcales bacterium]